MYYMLDERFQHCLEDQKTGSTVAGIKAAKHKLITIDLLGIEEQREIVRILDSLLSKEQQAHDAALATLDRIDEMKKAILAKAFRGQLGTNVASEETVVI